MKSKEKVINVVCLACGKKYDKKKKEAFGMWRGTCDMCGKKNVWVADAAHDFGIYSNAAIEVKDKVDDLL